MTVSYPFDTTGLSAANLVANEPHTLTEINASTYRILIPEFAPFYLDNLKLTHVAVNGALTVLVPDVDYYVSLPFVGASRSIGKMVYGGLSINSRLIDGHIKVDYQALGGDWVADAQFVRERLAEMIYNPKTTIWDIVTNKTNEFPPINHDLNMDQTMGLDSLVAGMNSLVTAIANKVQPATQSQVTAGTDNVRYVTPLTLKGATDALRALPVPSHKHTITDVTGLQAALDAKSPTTHTHATASGTVSGLMSATDKANLDNVMVKYPSMATYNADGSLNVGTPTAMDQAVSMDYYYDSKYLNFDPKIGKDNDDCVRVASRFDYSLYENGNVTVVNDYDQEVLYYTASDGLTIPQMFKAFKGSTESSWNFVPDPVRPHFLTSTEAITDVYTAGDDHILLNIRNSVGPTNRQTLIKTYGKDDTDLWERVEFSTVNPFASPRNATIFLTEGTALCVTYSGNDIFAEVRKLSDWSLLGVKRNVFNWLTGVDYTSANVASTSTKGIRVIASHYLKDTNNLVIYLTLIVYYTTTTGVNTYAIKQVPLSFDLSNVVLTTGINAEVLTQLIPASQLVFFNSNNAITDTGSSQNYSFSNETKTLYLNDKTAYNQSTIIAWKKPITGQFTTYADFTSAVGKLVAAIPDSSPWSKSLSNIFLVNQTTCLFYGNSTKYGTRALIGEYYVSNGYIKIKPGRWRFLAANPKGIEPGVLDNAIVDAGVLADVTNTGNCYANISVKVKADGSCDYYHCNLGNRKISKLAFDDVNLTVTATDTGVLVPLAATGHSSHRSPAYDAARGLFYSLLTVAGEYNSFRLGAYNYATNSWSVSGFINEDIANGSRSSLYGTTVAVNALITGYRPNTLIDVDGSVLTALTFGTVGGTAQIKYNKIAYDLSIFTVSQSGIGLSPYQQGNFSYVKNTGYINSYSYSGNVRSVSLNVSADIATMLTSQASDLVMYVEGSTGLLTYISSQDIFVGGHWSRLQDTSLTLLPNTTNYIYVRRSATDIRVLEVYTSTSQKANNFNRILIASVTTDANNPISQVTYRITASAGTVTKNDVGLGNVDNTSDADKPISIATQAALDGKSAVGHKHLGADITDLLSIIDARVNSAVAAIGLTGWGTDYVDATASRAFGIEYPAHTKNIVINLTVQCSGGGSARYSVYLDGVYSGRISPIEYQGGGGTYEGSDSFVIPAGKKYEIRNDAGAFGSLSIIKWFELR